MLEDWIYEGLVNDPYDEFMINEDKEITRNRLKNEFDDKYPLSFFFNTGNDYS